MQLISYQISSVSLAKQLPFETQQKLFLVESRSSNMKKHLLKIIFLFIFQQISTINSGFVTYIDELNAWYNPKLANGKGWVDYDGKKNDHTKYRVGIDFNITVSGINYFLVIQSSFSLFFL